MTRWREKPLPPDSFRSLHGTARHELQFLQDDAAGGATQRRLVTESGRHATARIRLVRRPATRRVYGYLVWCEQGRRTELLIGEVAATTRHANLKACWQVVHEHQLLAPEARQNWERRSRSQPDGR